MEGLKSFEEELFPTQKIFAKIAMFNPHFNDEDVELNSVGTTDLREITTYNKDDIKILINEINSFNLDFLEIPSFTSFPYSIEIADQIIKKSKINKEVCVVTKMLFTNYYDTTYERSYIYSLYRAFAFQERESDFCLTIRFIIDSRDFKGGSDSILGISLENTIKIFHRDYRNLKNFKPEFVVDNGINIEAILPYVKNAKLSLDNNNQSTINGTINFDDGYVVEMKFLRNIKPQELNSPNILLDKKDFIRIEKELTPLYHYGRAAKLFFSTAPFEKVY